MTEKILAGLGLAGCLALLAGLWLGRERLERWRARLAHTLRWRQRRAAARREAASAIERARKAVERDGNVYRPRSFNGRPPEDPE